MVISYGLNGINAMELKRLRYSISLKSQILYVHGHDPQFLYVEFEEGYAHIWTLCDTQAHHYPRKFSILPKSDIYTGTGQPITVANTDAWQFWDEGAGTTEEFNASRFLPWKYLDTERTHK